MSSFSQKSWLFALSCTDTTFDDFVGWVYEDFFLVLIVDDFIQYKNAWYAVHAGARHDFKGYESLNLDMKQNMVCVGGLFETFCSAI